MKIQKLEQLRELIKEGWELDAKSGQYNCRAVENGRGQSFLEHGKYRLKSPQGDIIPVEYCKGDLDEHTFKVGDKVRCKPGYNKGDGRKVNKGGHGYKEGLVVEIGQIERMTHGILVVTVGDGHGIWTRALELVEAKVEDCMYVELLTDEYGFKKGDIGLRKKLSSECILVPNRFSTSQLNPYVKIHNFNLKPSTKEAYDEQHNKPKEIEVGDTVEVIDNGRTYTTHDEAAESLSLTNWARNKMPAKGMLATVLDIEGLISGISDRNGKQYLIGIEGLKLIKKGDSQPTSEGYINKEVWNDRSEESIEVQRVNQPYRRTSTSGRSRFAGTESQISNRGGFSRKSKRPRISSGRTY